MNMWRFSQPFSFFINKSFQRPIVSWRMTKLFSSLNLAFQPLTRSKLRCCISQGHLEGYCDWFSVISCSCFLVLFGTTKGKRNFEIEDLCLESIRKTPKSKQVGPFVFGSQCFCSQVASTSCVQTDTTWCSSFYFPCWLDLAMLLT